MTIVKKILVVIIATSIVAFFSPQYVAVSHTSQTIDDLRVYQPWADDVPAGQEIKNIIGFVDTGCSPEIDPTGSLKENILGGWDAVASNNEFDPISKNPEIYADLHPEYHGTRVMGVTASYLGVARHAQMLIVRAALKTSDGRVRLNVLAAARGIKWLVNQGAKLINCSWGSTSIQEIRDAVAYAESKGVPIIAAAGNDSLNKDQQPDCWELPNANVLRVASAMKNGTLASNSAWGPATVEFAVKVEEILYVDSTETSYVSSFTGTSAAAAITTGVAGLLLNSLPVEQIFSRLIGTVSRQDSLNGKLWTGGILSPGRALRGEISPPLDSINFKGKFKNMKKLVINGMQIPLDTQASNPLLRIWVQNSLVGVISPQQDGTFSFVTKGRFSSGTEVHVQSSLGGDMKWNIP